MEASCKASVFGILVNLALCETWCLIIPDFIGLLWPLHRQLWLTVCFTGSVESESFLCPSEMEKIDRHLVCNLSFVNVDKLGIVQIG